MRDLDTVPAQSQSPIKYPNSVRIYVRTCVIHGVTRMSVRNQPHALRTGYLKVLTRLTNRWHACVAFGDIVPYVVSRQILAGDRRGDFFYEYLAVPGNHH